MHPKNLFGGQDGGDDRRESTRRLLRTKARFAGVGHPLAEVRTIDVSDGGVCVALSISLPPGTPCRVAFELPLRNGERFAVEAEALVANTVLAANGDGFRTGLKFNDIDKATAQALQSFVLG